MQSLICYIPDALPTDRCSALHPLPKRILQTSALWQLRTTRGVSASDLPQLVVVGEDNTSVSRLRLDQQAVYVLGRDPRRVDITLEHPSCSHEHAALCYKLPLPKHLRPRTAVEYEDELWDTTSSTVEERTVPELPELYLIDLGSSNGTFMNDAEIEPFVYYPLLHRDVIRFGLSSRRYVIIEEQVGM